MSLARMSQVLTTHQQSHLLAFLDSVRPTFIGPERALRLVSDLATVDWTVVAEAKRLLARRASPAQVDETPSPAPMLELASREHPCPRHADAVAAEKGGERAYREGKVAYLLLAGGQGTRLGFDAPKGLYPIFAPLDAIRQGSHANPPGDVPHSDSLFAGFSAALKQCEATHRVQPLLAIMTSSETHSRTVEAWEAAAHFGLDPSRVRFFQQASLPALDQGGRLLVAPDGGLAWAPDGHGGAVSALAKSGTLAWLAEHGADWLITFQVDNPAVRLVDPGFVGLASTQGADVGLKAVRKMEPSERVGVVAERGGRACIVEYTELTAEQQSLRVGDGSLAFKAGSIAFHIFRLGFLARIAGGEGVLEATLPLHLAHKKVACLDTSGAAVQPTAPNAYKFERFIFDVLPHGERVFTLEVPRAREFLPVKDAEGVNSPESVRANMLAEWRRCAGAQAQWPSPEEWQRRW